MDEPRTTINAKPPRRRLTRLGLAAVVGILATQAMQAETNVAAVVEVVEVDPLAPEPVLVFEQGVAGHALWAQTSWAQTFAPAVAPVGNGAGGQINGPGNGPGNKAAGPGSLFGPGSIPIGVKPPPISGIIP